MSDDDLFDSDFDLRSDTPEGKDPDAYSKRLRRYHRMLWSQELPNGQVFELVAEKRTVYLAHDSELGRFVLSSDTIATSHRKRLAHLYAQQSAGENERFHRQGYTIGGTMVFPGVPVAGKQTINQRRGTHRQIEDRFDLTLECIKRHYSGESSPLEETLDAYRSFFDLFVNFTGYVKFFHLSHLVDESGDIRHFHPFVEFGPSPLPDTLEAYVAYRERTLDFVRARNRQIQKWVVDNGRERSW
ncbi:MAG: hypothetical protein K2X36_00395 [Microbacteriaceae bacterium]|nr:hypothetical protein [Microbacteriaceae bacterium]